MKYIGRVLLTLGIMMGVGIVLQAKALADTNSKVTDEQLLQIKQNCTDIDASLMRIHADDALLRVELGRLYESIITDLMAPLNSRISINRLDSSTLVSTTSDYQNDLNTFRSAYQNYEQLLSAAMKIDCKNEPVKFYEKLQDAKKARQAVHKASLQLTADIKQYKHSFDGFVSSFHKEQK